MVSVQGGGIQPQTGRIHLPAGGGELGLADEARRLEPLDQGLLGLSPSPSPGSGGAEFAVFWD